MVAAGFLVLQLRVGEGELGAFGNGLERDLGARLAGVWHAVFPAQLITTRCGRTISRNPPLLSYSMFPSNRRTRRRERPPPRGSDSAPSTGPAPGPHHCAIPSAVVTA